MFVPPRARITLAATALFAAFSAPVAAAWSGFDLRLPLYLQAFLLQPPPVQPPAPPTSGTPLTLIQMGDVHGHLVARPNLRSDGSGVKEGGLARMATRIGQIRQANPGATLLVNTGDTLQGGAEAMFTAGQVMVSVLNNLAIDAYAPGNWDFSYGALRFMQFFTALGPPNPPGFPPVTPATKAWGALAANLYYNDEIPQTAPYAGQRVLPPYAVKTVNGLRVGLIGLTSGDAEMNQQPATNGLEFTTDGRELPELIATLRNDEQVDVVVLISEFGLAKNLVLAERYPGIDVVLSSDTHEETTRPVVARSGTILTENGQDGTALAELRLTVRDRKVVAWDYISHTITPDIPEQPQLAAAIKNIRSNFLAGPNFPCKALPPGNTRGCVNPINQTRLATPIDTPVAKALADLQRSNFSHEAMPAVIEGTSSNLLSEAFRVQADADIGQIRGYRYGTHVASADDLVLEDLFHWLGTGAQIARIQVKGWQLKYQMEYVLDRVIHPDPLTWSGGWFGAWAGVRAWIDPAGVPGARVKGVQVYDRVAKRWKLLNPYRSYSYAGYYFDIRPDVVGGMPVPEGERAVVVKGPNGERLDATSVVMNYLATHPAHPGPRRYPLLAPLPAPLFDFDEIQPLRGVCPRASFGCLLPTPTLPQLSGLMNR